MTKKKEITDESIRYVSDNKLNQMYNSYCDWCRKHNYNLVNMNMYRSVGYRIQRVVFEITRRTKNKIRQKMKK